MNSVNETEKSVVISYVDELKAQYLSRISNNLYSSFVKILFSPLAWILLITILVFSTYDEPYWASGDSPGYTNFYHNIFKGETDIRRTPGYPYFIKIAERIAGETLELEHGYGPETIYSLQKGEALTAISLHGFMVYPAHVVSGFRAVSVLIKMQLLLYLAALAVFYYASQKLISNKWIHSLMVLFIALFFVHFQLWIMTEPVSISLTLIFTSLMIHYVTTPHSFLAVILGGLVLIMVMVRPAFLILYPLLFAFLLLRCVVLPKERIQCIWGLAAVLMSSLLLLGYCKLNEKNYGAATITRVGTGNGIALFAFWGLYENGCDPEINEAFKNSEYLSDNDINKCRLRSELKSKFGLKRMQDYVSKSIKKNFASFFVLTVKRMFWYRQYPSFLLYYSIGALDFILLIVTAFKAKVFPWLRLGCWFFFYSSLFGVFWGSNSEHARLMMSVAPVFYLILFLHIDLFCNFYTQSKSQFWKIVHDRLYQ